MKIVNIAAYKFAEITDPASWLEPLKEKCLSLGLKGTIIVAAEGINLFLAAEREPIDSFLQYLRHNEFFDGRFADIEVKESLSDRQPFQRMVVRQAKEIITMRRPTICPSRKRASAVTPIQLKKWIEQGHDDEGRELVLLDTRNDYEVEIGTFENAIDLGIQSFSQFPEAFEKTDMNTLKDKAIVSFCTGGIRCEKSVLYLEELGYTQAYQLDGGILRYFEDVGQDYFRGACFVFDERRELHPQPKKP